MIEFTVEKMKCGGFYWTDEKNWEVFGPDSKSQVSFYYKNNRSLVLCLLTFLFNDYVFLPQNLFYQLKNLNLHLCQLA